MYLKSLELQGFKSFPDKVKLTFDKGLTGVVGPNGSGKSNIGDAVRWVLGEQSTKTLRGNKMEDVIFSGTTERKPVGFASVTLTIDNSDSELNNPENEVAVTRKIYRSGESEYRINGKSVRLKDINELFMDTGLGRDGYSIIGQGRIAEIVDAKSSERRDIFEEAAGISKFRYRKAEAERKLAAAEDNITRLQDIVSELSARKDPLCEQAKKAEKYLVLAEERKNLELALWLNDLDEFGKKIDKISEDSLIFTSQYENTEALIEKFENDIQTGYQNMREITLRIDEFKSGILEAQKESSSFDAENAVCRNDIEHAEKLIESINERKANEAESEKALDEKIQSFNNELSEKQNEVKKIADEIRKTEQDFIAIEEQTKTAEENFSEKEGSINELYFKENDLKLKITTAEASMKETEEQISENDAQKENISSSFEKYKNQIKEAEDALENANEKENECINKAAGLNLIYKNKKSKYDEKKEQFEKILFEIKEKRQRAGVLKDLENSMEGFNYSVKEIIKASRNGRISGIFGTVAQLITVDEKYVQAVETALGGALQNVIVQNEDTAKRCIALLKELKKGRATFLPVTSIKPYSFNENAVRKENGFLALGNEAVSCDSKFDDIMSNLLGRTVIAEDIDYASIIAKKYGYKFRIVTLDGQIINAGGSFTGGSAVSSHGVLSRKNDIAELESSIEKLSGEQEELKTETEDLKAQTEKLRLEIEGMNEEKKKINEEQIRFRSEITTAKSVLEESGKQLKSFEDSKEKLLRKLDENKAVTEKASEELSEIRRKIDELQAGIDSEQQIKETLAEKRDALSEELYSLKLKKVEAENGIEAVKQEIRHSCDLRSSLSENSKQYDGQIEEQNRIIKEKNEKIEENLKKISQISEKTDSYNEKIKQSSEEHDEQEKRVTELRNEQKKNNDDKERISVEISRLDEKKISLQRDYDAVVSKMWEAYEMTRSEAAAFASPVENISEAQKRLNSLKSSIRSLGSINVAAIEEYKEVSERFEFLSGQLSDVENSKKELEKLIVELTSDMRRMFAECFTEINKNFREIFTELFGGGQANLELTDPENVLESGIEIKVAPPGKVIKNLISLSGGEQSFVAIAIYFAILKIRPAPFCILDEIDAALDEVNVRKYAMYLKNFINTTQFIIVTHRRGTMELANVLYGVTMQHNGVSKLLKMTQADIPDEVSAANQQN